MLKLGIGSDLGYPIQSTFIPDNKVHNTYYIYSNKSKEKKNDELCTTERDRRE